MITKGDKAQAIAIRDIVAKLMDHAKARGMRLSGGANLRIDSYLDRPWDYQAGLTAGYNADRLLVFLDWAAVGPSKPQAKVRAKRLKVKLFHLDNPLLISEFALFSTGLKAGHAFCGDRKSIAAASARKMQLQVDRSDPFRADSVWVDQIDHYYFDNAIRGKGEGTL